MPQRITLHALAFSRVLDGCERVEGAQGAARASAVQCLYRRYALLMAEDLVHMNMEETENNAVLWATHTDEEIRAITDRLVASIPAAQLEVFLPWMMRANSPQTRAMLIADRRARDPAHHPRRAAQDA